MTTRLLMFAYIGHRRRLRPRAGTDAPTAPVWEVRVYPGRMRVFGETFEEGVEMMQGMIDQAMDYHGSEEGWYDAEWAKLSSEQRAMFQRVVATCANRVRALPERSDSPRPLPMGMVTYEETEEDIGALCGAT